MTEADCSALVDKASPYWWVSFTAWDSATKSCYFVPATAYPSAPTPEAIDQVCQVHSLLWYT